MALRRVPQTLGLAVYSNESTGAGGEAHGRALAGNVAVEDSDDQGIGAAMLEELGDRVAHRAGLPERPDDALVLGEALNPDGLVDGTAIGAPDEGGDRGGHAGDGVHTAGHLLYVDSGIAKLYRHV